MKTALFVPQNECRIKTLIDELTHRIRRTNQIIEKYNSIDGLRPIITAEDAAEFVKAPIKFLDDSIRRDFYIRIDGVENPDINAVAMIFKIPYIDLSADIRTGRPDLLKWDYVYFKKTSMTIEMKPGAVNKIRQELIKAEDVEICKLLNAHITRHKLSSDVVRTIAPMLNLGIRHKS
jgi:hypothetical protein